MDIYYDNDFDIDLKGGKIAIPILKKMFKESYKNKKKTSSNINNLYYLDNDLSTDKTKVYINKNTNEISMVNRGTSDIKDVITDIKMFFGYKDNRFNEGRDILNKIKEKYPNNPIDILGHSLGASIAENLGNDPQVKNVITLNKPTTPLDLINKSKINDKQYDIRAEKDIVSLLAPIQKDKNDIVIPSTTNNIYTEHKVDILDRLNQDLIIGSGKKRLKKEDMKKIVRKFIKTNKNDITDDDRLFLLRFLKS
jgi:hypothetical protein